MGIIGFAVGALIAVLIRLAQGLDPNPTAPLAYVGPAFVLGAFISSGFFVWGMGAFDPRMSVHGEEHAADAEAEAGAGPVMTAARRRRPPAARPQPRLRSRSAAVRVAW